MTTQPALGPIGQQLDRLVDGLGQLEHRLQTAELTDAKRANQLDRIERQVLSIARRLDQLDDQLDADAEQRDIVVGRAARRPLFPPRVTVPTDSDRPRLGLFGQPDRDSDR